MKKSISIVFFLLFCINQFHIIETIANFYNKQICKVHSIDNNDTDSDNEEEGTSSENDAKKEIECALLNATFADFSKIVATQLKHNSRFFNRLYTNPYTQKDIKPPCFS